MPAEAPTPALIVGYGVVQSTDGRVLLLHRKEGSPPWADRWWLPGGPTLAEEDVDDTVPRVLLQGLGLSLGGVRFVETVFGEEPETGRHTIHNIYAVDERVEAKAETPLLRLEGPFDAVEWLAPEELRERELPAPQLAGARAVLGGAVAPRVEPLDMVEAWDAISTHYQEFAAIPSDQIHYGGGTPTENELGLLGDLRDKTVLDVGCGGGQNTIALRRAGAASVVGVDKSTEQLAYATRLAAEEKVDVRFLEADVRDLAPLEDASFDAAFSAYCLQFVPEIGATFSAVARVLRPGGRFAFCLDHPTYMMFPDAAAETGGAPVLGKGYFQREHEWQWLFPSGYAHRMTAHYHTMEDLFAALRGAGFIVERLLEPTFEERQVGKWQRNPELERQVPRTIIMSGWKPTEGEGR